MGGGFGGTPGSTYTGTSRFLVVDAHVRFAFNDLLAGAVGVDNLINQPYRASHPYSQCNYSADIALAL